MKEIVLNTIFEPKLRDPVFVVGLPGIGDVGRLVVQRIIKSSEAKLFAELYSPYFPDILIAEGNGICHLPRYTFWASSSSDPNIIVLTGEFHPISDDIRAYHAISGTILDVAKKYGSKWVITIGGYSRPAEETGRIYVSSTSKEITASLASHGATVYRGRIVGMTGVLIGLASISGLKGACILGVTSGIAPDYAVATNVYKLLSSFINLKRKSF